MPLNLVQSTSTFQSSLQKTATITHFKLYNHNPFAVTTTTTLLPKTLLPDFPIKPTLTLKYFLNSRAYCKKNYLGHSNTSSISASLLENPILWAGRICVFYALLKAGLAGSQSNPILSGCY